MILLFVETKKITIIFPKIKADYQAEMRPVVVEIIDGDQL